jgi:Skp family chaperone for outer membrane proteins
MTRPVVLLACLAALGLSAAANAQTPAPAAAPAQTAALPATAAFLVMDADRLAAESTAMRSVFDQMAKRRDIEVAAYNMAVDKLDAEFEPALKARATMDPAEFQNAQDQYNTIRSQIDGVLKTVQDGMNAAGEKAIAQFNTAATLIGQQVRQEHGVSRFVDGSAVLYIREGSGYDVTDEVIKRVNAKLPDITVEFPPRAKPPAAAEPAKKPATKKK